jgi:serralysin
MGAVSGDDVGISSTTGQNSVFVGSTGSIYGGMFGIELSGGSSHQIVRNEGQIIGHRGNGLYLRGGSGHVYNAGIISSYSDVAITLNTGSGSLVLNSGSIMGGYISGEYLALFGGEGNDQITNTGLIQGNVNLFDGNDVFDNRLGTIINGIINLGAGNNRAFGSAGKDRFRGGLGNDTIDGGDGDDQLIISNGLVDITLNLRRTDVQPTGAGNGLYLNFEDVQTGDGDDSIIGSDADNVILTSEGNDTLEGGLGDDALFGDIGIDMGTDTAVFSGTAGATVNLSLQGERQNTGYGWDILNGIENLRGGAGNDVFKGDGAANLLEGAGGNDTLQGNAGNDTLDGGTGTNTAVYAGSRADYRIQNVSGGVTVEGQGARAVDGTDQLKNIRFLKFDDGVIALTNAAPTGLALSATSVAENASVGSVVATLSAQDTDGDDVRYSLSAGSPFAIVGNKLVVAKAVDFEAGRQHSVTVQAQDDYQGVTTQTFAIAVTNEVEAAPFVLQGGAGADVLQGEAGADTIYGGDGRDMLAGGAGSDVFVFNARTGRTNVDAIDDFVVRDDSIWLDNAVFKALGSKGSLAKPQKLDSDAFVTATRAQDKEDRVVYDKKTGKLYYDQDGAGGKAQVQIAALGKNLKMTAADFFVI